MCELAEPQVSPPDARANPQLACQTRSGVLHGADVLLFHGMPLLL